VVVDSPLKKSPQRMLKNERGIKTALDRAASQGDMEKAPSCAPSNIESSDDSFSDLDSDSDLSDDDIKDGDDDATKKMAKKRRKAKKMKKAKNKKKAKI
jgi:hypothetical protein